MVQPVNYRAFFPQINPGQSFLQGLQSGQAMRLAQEQAQALAAKQAETEAFKQRALLTNAPEDFKLWAAADPNAAKTFSETLANMSKEQRSQEFNAALPVYQALQNGEVTTAMKLVRRRADALRNSGQEVEADNMDLLHQYIGNNDPSKAINNIQFLLNNIDPDRFGKMQENLAKSQPNIEKANQNYVKMFGRHAYSLIQQGKPTDAIAMLDTRIQEGKQKGYNTEPLEVMKMEAESRFDGSPDSIGLVLSGIDEKLGEDLKNIGEIALKKAQTEETTARNTINKDFAAKQAQADLAVKLAQAAQTQAETAATEQKRLLDAEMQPRIQAAELAKTQAETAAKQQATLIEAQYTPVLKELEIKAAQAKAAADARQAEIDAKYKEPMEALKLQAQQAATAKAQRDNEIEAKYTPVLKELEIKAAQAKAAADARQAEIDAKYKEPMEALKLQAQQAATAKAQRDNEIEAKYADQVAQAKMTTEQANARIAEEKAANAQVFEQSQARLADANAQIAAEKAEVARPAEQAALELSQANARMAQEKAAVAQPVEQANAEIARINAEKAARENAIGQDLDRAKAEATTREAEAKAKSAEAAAKYAEETELISLKEKRRAYEQARKKENLEVDQLAANLGLTKNQITKVKVETNLLSAQAQKARMEAESFGKGIMPPEQKAKFETELRKEYTAVSEGYRNTRDAYQQLQAVKKRGTGISDQAMINLFQRMIDPKGVVREPDVEALMKSSGAFAGVMQTLEKWKSGEKLSPLQRQQIIDAAGDIYKVAEKNNNLQKKSIEKFADEYKFNKSFIFQPESGGTNAEIGTAMPQGAKPTASKNIKVDY